DRRGAGSSGPPAPIVEGRAPFVKNRSFVLPSFFKPVTDWARPAACTGGQNAVYSDHEKRPGFPAPGGACGRDASGGPLARGGRESRSGPLARALVCAQERWCFCARNRSSVCETDRQGLFA